MTSPAESIQWRRSSRCDSGACIEIGYTDEDSCIYMRNSVLPSVMLTFTPAEWKAFSDGVRAGEFAHVGITKVTYHGVHGSRATEDQS